MDAAAPTSRSQSQTISSPRFYARRGCELGDGDACLEAAPDDLPVLRAMRELLRQEWTRPEPAAQASLACEPPTTPVLRLEAVSVETYCVASDGHKHGAFVRWATPEDRTQGEPHGTQRVRARYRLGKLDGDYLERNLDGELTARGRYTSTPARRPSASLRTGACATWRTGWATA
jgi:hypothetical protein